MSDLKQSTLQKSKNFTIDEQYKEDYEKLKEFLSEHTKRAYLVGGCVRDFYLGIQSDDFDIEVYDIEGDSFQALMEGFGCVRVGKSFNVYKWGAFDIALPRTETKNGVGHTAFDTALARDEKTASMRRDFCMNAIMLNIFTMELLDFWNGLHDIKNRTIRLIDKNKFAEDSLRVLRAMQFAARFGFKIEKKTIEVCRQISLDDLSKERVFMEFEKMFRASWLDYGLYYSLKMEILDRLFGIKINFGDFLKLCKNYKKNGKYIFHPYKEYFFLFSFFNLLHIRLIPILQKLNAPKSYYRILLIQKRKPQSLHDVKKVNEKFLIALSLKYPIQKWLGCDKEIEKTVKKLAIYDKSFEHTILISDVIKDGFEKEEIKKEYKKRVCEMLRNLA